MKQYFQEPLLKPGAPRACTPQQEKPPQWKSDEAEPLLATARESLCGNKDPAQLKIKIAIMTTTKKHSTNFPGGSGVKTSHFHCRRWGSILGKATRIPHAAQ